MDDFEVGYRAIILGSSGGGKTYFVQNILFGPGGKFYRYYDRIFVFAPSTDNDAGWARMATSYGIPVTIIHDDFAAKLSDSFEQLGDIQEQLDRLRQPRLKVAYLFDDLVADRSLFRSRGGTPVDTLWIRGRQRGADGFILSQLYNGGCLDINLRSTNLTHLIVFPSGHKNLDQLVEDHSPNGVSMKQLRGRIAAYFDESPKYSHLIFNTLSTGHRTKIKKSTDGEPLELDLDLVLPTKPTA